MAFVIKSTSTVTNDGVRISLAGQSGTGKTFSLRTLSRPLILSSEKGLLSLKGYDLPYVEINSTKDLKDALEEIKKPEVWDNIDTIAIDSISDIAEKCLIENKKKTKDGRAAYGNLTDEVIDTLNDICSLKGKDIVCIFKLSRIEDPDTGKVTYGAATVTDKLALKMPYIFDEVLILQTSVTEENGIMRYIQTFNDSHYLAKDRSGCLDPYEPADLGLIISKIKGGVNG